MVALAIKVTGRLKPDVIGVGMVVHHKTPTKRLGPRPSSSKAGSIPFGSHHSNLFFTANTLVSTVKHTCVCCHHNTIENFIGARETASLSPHNRGSHVALQTNQKADPQHPATKIPTPASAPSLTAAETKPGPSKGACGRLASTTKHPRPASHSDGLGQVGTNLRARRLGLRHVHGRPCPHGTLHSMGTIPSERRSSATPLCLCGARRCCRKTPFGQRGNWRQRRRRVSPRQRSRKRLALVTTTPPSNH